MTNYPPVRLEGINKTFKTTHIFQADEETRKRRFYKKNLVNAAIDISFDIAEGEVFGLLGPNGAGKTTAVKMICGLVRPDSGTVFVDGKDVERKRREILRKVGVVLEGTRTSIWPLTPYENLMYYGNLKNMRGPVLRERAHELLDFIGLQEKKNTEVRRLSRGQKQKLAICIGLITDPRVILLDEPTTGLDVQSARAIKDKIIEMTRQDGRSVLVTTHDMHVAQELCDRIGIIDRGKMVTCKPTEELLSLFSEQIYAFNLDERPQSESIADIEGVLSVEIEDNEGPVLVVRIAPEFEERSATLYAIVENLRGQGHQLRAINQRQQNLESVFLKLTKSTI